MDAVLLAPVSPFRSSDGHRQGFLSYIRRFLDNKIDVGLIAPTYDDDEDAMEQFCPTMRIRAVRDGFALLPLVHATQALAQPMIKIWRKVDLEAPPSTLV